MQSQYSTQFYKINDIAGMFYSKHKSADTIVVYGIGAPIPPDNGTLPDAPYILNYPVDLFVPDYIGYGRSNGIFTPLNCIKSFIDLYTAFINGCVAANSYSQTVKKFKYKRVIFIGRSFGGTYIPLLPRFNKNIQELAILCPVVDSGSCGTILGEETNEDFLRSMRVDGYHHLYRGILNPEWNSHLENKDDLSPMDNIAHLSSAKLFIAHGKKDKCVSYIKSVKYFEKITNKFANKKEQFKLNLYPQGEHGSTTTNAAIIDFFDWLGLIGTETSGKS